MQKDSRADTGRFLGLDQKWYGTYTDQPDGSWDRVAKDMLQKFSESGHPVFRGCSALERGDLKGKVKLSIHFCGDDKTFEVVLRTIVSVNELGIYGAVADMCDELACSISDCSERTEGLVAQDNTETTVILTELMTTNKSPPTDENVQGKLLHNDEQKFANLPYHLQLTKLCSNVGITMTVASGQYFSIVDDAELDKMGGSCREYTLPRGDKLSKVGWISWNTKIGPALEVAVSHCQRTLRNRDNDTTLIR